MLALLALTRAFQYALEQLEPAPFVVFLKYYVEGGLQEIYGPFVTPSHTSIPSPSHTAHAPSCPSFSIILILAFFVLGSLVCGACMVIRRTIRPAALPPPPSPPPPRSEKMILLESTIGSMAEVAMREVPVINRLPWNGATWVSCFGFIQALMAGSGGILNCLRCLFAVTKTLFVVISLAIRIMTTVLCGILAGIVLVHPDTLYALATIKWMFTSVGFSLL